MHLLDRRHRQQFRTLPVTEQFLWGRIYSALRRSKDWFSPWSVSNTSTRPVTAGHWWCPYTTFRDFLHRWFCRKEEFSLLPRFEWILSFVWLFINFLIITRSNESFYFSTGILFAITVIGPAFGYVMSSALLRFYVDVDKSLGKSDMLRLLLKNVK